MGMIAETRPIQVQLRKDLVRNIKRGHAWLYSDALETVQEEAGPQAIIFDRKRQAVACGMYSADHPIRVRVCRTQPPFVLDDEWLIGKLRAAVSLRSRCFSADTTAFRLVAGEGDGLPGLVMDVYDRVLVIKVDGGAPQAFYQPQQIAEWLMQELNLSCVILRSRHRQGGGTFTQTAEVLCGQLSTNPVAFLENGLAFTADVLHGQKTGFFLDQRDNRSLVRSLSKGLRVLNLFSFSGGFSIAAGVGGASHVTSVDIAKPAIEAADRHWLDNGLEPKQHASEAIDCFEFLDRAAKAHEHWDLVICDPPSFAPSERSREKAIPAYGKLAQLAARVTGSGGLLAAASCSSHVTSLEFSSINAEALGKERRNATLLCDRGLPPDHPTPLAMPELRYLKFQLFRLD
ncbi:MAG: class I SAM-dependent rRNA methyltransferase [Planctomycetales bacterium]|nr:class I SAM-dependent rRNA methyltransferase [Planctomycetales bacterium]